MPSEPIKLKESKPEEIEVLPEKIFPGEAIDYSKIKLRKKTRINDLKLIYEHNWFDEEKNEYITSYRIWEIDHGKLQKKHYLITDPNTALHRGIQFIYLAPIKDWTKDVPVKEMIELICNEHSIELKKELATDTKFEVLLSVHKNNKRIFFENPNLITSEEEKEILTWDWNSLEHDFDYEGLEKDQDIVYGLRPLNITFTLDPLREENLWANVQKYQAHLLVLSITKAGKTTLGKKKARLTGQLAGYYYSRARGSAIAGWSGADSVRTSDIQGKVGPVVLDNVQNFDTESLKHTIELEETAETSTGTGMKTVNTIAACPFVLFANPENVTDPLVLAQSFLSVIRNFTTSEIGMDAIGSRHPEHIFKCKKESQVKGTPLDNEIVLKNRMIFEYILLKANRVVEKDIFPDKDIQTWLNKILPEYAKVIVGLLKSSISTDKDLKAYWIGHATGAFRHIRGYALKQAIMDNLKEIYTGKYNIKTILNDAEEHVKHICNLNIDFLSNILQLTSTTPADEWVKKNYESLKGNARAVVLAVVAYFKANQKLIMDGYIFPFQSTADYYNALPLEKRDKTYSRFGLIEANIPLDLDKFNRKVGDFGFYLVKAGDIISVRVENDSELKTVIQLI
jgi:hypothetical protein